MATAEGRLAIRAANRRGLFTLDEARTAGLTRHLLYQRVGSGIYERVGAGVFAIAGVAWTWERRAASALLVAGPDARLSFRAAAHLLGFDGFGECPIELTLPRGRKSSTELAIVHTTHDLRPLDRVGVRGLPVTSGARTIIDLCAAGATDDELSAAIGSALRDGYTSKPFHEKSLADLRAPGRHGVRLLDRVLRGPIGHSHLEREFLKLVRQAGLRDPETQVTFDSDGIVRVDAFCPPERVVAEVMRHRFHVTREQQQRYVHRRNELQDIGNLVLEFTTKDVAERPAYCMARLRRNLLARTPSGS